MSIDLPFSLLAQATTTPAVQEATVGQMLVSATIFLLVGLALAAPLGVFRRRNVVGPVRLRGEGESRGLARGLAVVTLCGVTVWIACQIWFVGLASRSLTPEQRAGGDLNELISPSYFAILATVPALTGLLVLIIGDHLLGRSLVEKLGFSLSRLPRGIVVGVIGILTIIPLIYSCSIVMQLVYTLVGYEHPAAHDLLLKMNDAGSDKITKYGLIFGAVVCAPVFEEFLFRGHLQSILLAFYQKFLPAAEMPVRGFPVTGLDGVPLPPLPEPLGPEPIWPRWAAILTTAFLFTVIHAAWTAPPIFLLAIALGYVYERTGNLWAAIVVHALFNGLSTLVYVNSGL